MPRGICTLCLLEMELCDSHLIPSAITYALSDPARNEELRFQLAEAHLCPRKTIQKETRRSH
jgi:hypothetical protein